MEFKIVVSRIQTSIFTTALLLAAFRAQAGLPEKLAEELRSKPPAIDNALAATVRAHSFVGVGGFFSEGLSGYFRDNIDSLKKEFGVKYAKSVQSDTAVAMENDLDNVRTSLLKAYVDGGSRPLLVWGHSKGGAELLLLAIRDPGLLSSGVIDRIAIIQGAVGGAQVANKLPDMGGIGSLRRVRAQKLFAERWAALSPADQEIVRSHVYYVRARIDRDTPAPILLATWAVTASATAATGSKANDTVVLTDEQWLAGTGTDLGVLDGDHSDFVVSDFFWTNSNAKFKRAFTRALLRELFSGSRASTR